MRCMQREMRDVSLQVASGNWQVAVVSGKWQERPTPRREWSDNRGTGERQLGAKSKWAMATALSGAATGTDATKRRINRVKNVKEKSILTPSSKRWLPRCVACELAVR